MKSACAASLAATAALAVSVPAEAQPSIEWYSIDSGGGASSGGGFELNFRAGRRRGGETEANPVPGIQFVAVHFQTLLATRPLLLRGDDQVEPPVTIEILRDEVP